MEGNAFVERKKAAIRAYVSGDHAAALDLLQLLWRDDPTDRETALATSVLLARDGAVENAIAVLRTAHAHHRADATVAGRLAGLLMERGDHRCAVTALSHLDPQALAAPAIARTRIECLIEMRAFEEAGAVLAAAGPRLEPQVHLRLEVKLLERQGEHGAILARLAALPGVDDPWLAAALGRARLALGELTGALNAFDAAAQMEQARREAVIREDAALILSHQRALHDLDLCRYVADRYHDFDGHGVLAALDRQLKQWPPGQGTVCIDGAEMTALLALGRIWHRPPTALPDHALASGIAWPEVEATVRRDGLAVLDGFLTPAVLASLRRDLVESTIWFGDGYAKGYLASDLGTGLASPPLLRLIDEVRRALTPWYPGLAASAAWAFKYGAQVQGVDPHADFSRLTLNLWLTPDEANLDPDSGGLLFWPARAPAEASFREYNSDDAWLERLRAGRPPNRRVPHRCNRAILFDSALLHASDRIEFADRHDARRINLTIAFGHR